MYEHLLKTCDATGFKIRMVSTPPIEERLVLAIECDYNDSDFISKVTTFNVDDTNFNLEEIFKVLEILLKLKSTGRKTRSIIDMWVEQSDEDIKILHEYDKKHLTPNEVIYLTSKDIDIDDILEYYIADSSKWNTVSKIVNWFPTEYDLKSDSCESVNGCHTLISIKLQYFDGAGNIFDITPEK